MGNTSCKHVMANEMRKESNLYKSRYIIYVAASFTAWYLYANERYEGLDRWYIIPCAIYMTCYFVLGTLIYFLVDSLMDRNELNKRIYKCIQWQEANKNLCNKRMGKCIINPYAVEIWNPTKQFANAKAYPINMPSNSKKYYQYENYVEPRDFDLPNRVNTNMDNVKPGNFYN